MLAATFLVSLTHAQPTFPGNGISGEKPTTFAFTNATLITNERTTLTAATLLVKDGKILAAGTNVSVPKDAMVIDCKG